MTTSDDITTTHPNVTFNDNADDNNDGDLSLLPLPWSAVAVVLLSVAIVMTVGGNLLVMLSYRRDQGLRTVHTLYLLHLAVCDLMIGACSMPLYLIYTVLYWTWPLGRAMCKLFLVEDYTACCMSTLVVILVAADKLAVLTLGAKYQVVETRKRAYIKLAICWICAFLLYSPAILFCDVVRGYSILAADDCDSEYNDNPLYVVITEVLNFSVPFLSLTIINTCVFTELKKRRKTCHKSEATNAESSLQCSEASALTFGRKHGTVRDISDFPCQLLRKMKLQAIPNSSKKNCDPLTSSEVSSCSKMINTTSRYESLATSLYKSTPLTNQPSQILSDSQTTVCSSQLQESSSSQSVVSSIQSQQAGHFQDDAVSHSELQIGSLSRSTESTSRAHISLFQSSAYPSKAVPALFHTTSSGHVVIQNQAQREKQKRERRVAMILTGLVLALVVFWLPYSITTILQAVCKDCVNKDIYEVLNWLLWIKSCVNPLLYAYNCPRFRRKFRELLSHVLPFRLQKVKRKFKTARIGQDHVTTIRSNLTTGEYYSKSQVW